jgi:Lrp/AsnC family leucine-responsive transcriptional regulator
LGFFDTTEDIRGWHLPPAPKRRRLERRTIAPHRGGVGMEEKDKKEYEEVISSYYGDDQVAALVTFKIDTKGSDTVARKIAGFPFVEDVFLVTGDTDIIAKARFKNYAALKKFIVDDVADMEGVKETRTLMVVTTFKERGTIKVELEEQEEKQ